MRWILLAAAAVVLASCAAHEERAPDPAAVSVAAELDELGLTASAFARQIDVPANRISEIIRGLRAISGDTALRLGHWFDTSPQFWMNLQSIYEVDMAQQKTGAKIARLPKRKAA